MHVVFQYVRDGKNRDRWAELDVIPREGESVLVDEWVRRVIEVCYCPFVEAPYVTIRLS